MFQTPWNDPPCEVEEIHRSALATCRQVFADVCNSGQTSSLLISAETGSGKTHLLSRLRREFIKPLADGRQPVFCWVRFEESLDGVWPFIRRCLFGDLLRPVEAKLTQLDLTLRRRFPEQLGQQSEQGFFDYWTSDWFGKNRALKEAIETFCRDCAVNRNLREVLLRLHGADKQIASDYLRGDTNLLPTEVAKLGLRIDLSNHLEYTRDSRDLVLSICKLMGKEAPLVLCFDHIDALVQSPRSATLLGELVSAIDVLHDQAGSTKLLVTSAVASAQEQLKSIAGSGASATGEGSSLWARLAEHRVSLAPLIWEEAVALTLERLEVNAALSSLRKSQTERFWPLNEQRLLQRYEQIKRTCTPRAWLAVCHQEFLGGAKQPDGSSLVKRFQHHRSQIKAAKIKLRDDLLTGTLPWLARALCLGLDCVGTPSLPFRLVFRPNGKGTALAVHWFVEQPHWKTYDAFQKKWKPKELPRLVVFFGEQETSLTTGMKERVAKLRQAGGQTVFPVQEQLRDLTALQEILKEIKPDAPNRLTIDGQPIGEDQVVAWVRKEIVDGPPAALASLKELCLDVFAQLKPAASQPGIDLALEAMPS